jgi:hypothetical protein
MTENEKSLFVEGLQLLDDGMGRFMDLQSPHAKIITTLLSGILELAEHIIVSEPIE